MSKKTVLAFALLGLLSCKTAPKKNSGGGNSTNLGLATGQVDPNKRIGFDLATLVFQNQKIAQVKFQDVGQDYSEIEVCNGGKCQYTQNASATLVLPLNVGANGLRARACWAYGQTADKQPACGPWSGAKTYQQTSALDPKLAQALEAIPVLGYGFQEEADNLYQNLQTLEQAVKACPTYDRDRYAKVVALKNLASVSMASVLAKQAVFPKANSANGLQLVNEKAGPGIGLMLLLMMLNAPIPPEVAEVPRPAGDKEFDGVLDQISKMTKARDVKRLQAQWEKKADLKMQAGNDAANIRAAAFNKRKRAIIAACKEKYPELVRDRIAVIQDRAAKGLLTADDVTWLKEKAVIVDETLNIDAIVAADKAERARLLAEREAVGAAEAAAREPVVAEELGDRAPILSAAEESRRAAVLAEETRSLQGLEAEQKRLADMVDQQKKLAEEAKARLDLEGAEGPARQQLAEEAQRSRQAAEAAEQARLAQEGKIEAERRRVADLQLQIREPSPTKTPSSSRTAIPEVEVKSTRLGSMVESPLQSHSNAKINAISAAGGILVAASAVAIGVAIGQNNKGTNLATDCEGQAYDNFNQASTQVNDISQQIRDARDAYIAVLNK